MSDVSDNEKAENKELDLYPLTSRSQRIHNYQEKIEKVKENYIQCQKTYDQMNDLKRIKSNMERRKMTYLCHQKERQFSNKLKNQKLKNKFFTIYNINVTNSELQAKVFDKLARYEREEKNKIEKQKQRIDDVIHKLVREQKRQLQIEEEQNKTYTYRVKKRLTKPDTEEFFEYLEIEDEEIEEESEKEYVEQINEPVKKVKIKKGSEKGSKKSKASKKEKKSKKDKKSKKSKKNKKKKEKKVKTPPNPYSLPLIPIINAREKVDCDANMVTLGLLKTIDEGEQMMKSLKEQRPVTYPAENVTWKPQLTLFDDYEPGNMYKKKVTVRNNNKVVIFCSFSEITMSDPFLIPFINLEPTDMQKVLPGLSFTVYILFNPGEKIKYANGAMVYFSRKGNLPCKYQFKIPFKISHASNIIIKPLNIKFSSFRVWDIHKASNKYRTIQIENKTNNHCKIIIKKIKVEEYYDTTEEKISYKENSICSTSTSMFVQNVLSECISSIWENFYFDHYFLILRPKTKKDIKIYFKNPSYIGYYREKYHLEIIEIDSNEEISKNETITINGEVTGYILKLESDYIDFNICFFYYIYQENFRIINTESFPVKISIRFPLGAEKYFCISPQTTYIKPHGTENITVKFIPRKDIEDSIYFNNATNILNVSLNVYLISKEFWHTPPISVTIYAILCDANPMLVKPVTPTTTDIQGNVVLINLGTVTTHETVFSEFEIQNNSIVPQEYGFLNLPECITINPNYGFGSIEPYGVQKLSLHFSPAVWDTKQHLSRKLQVLKNTKFQITCVTVSEMGELQPKVNGSDHTIHENIPDTDDFIQYANIDNESFACVSKDRDMITSLNSLEMSVTTLENSQELSAIEYDTKQIAFAAMIHNNWCEISHQYVEFPDTPMGSFSTMDIYLKSGNNSSGPDCLCGYLKKKNFPNFKCHFEIFGSSAELSIEPLCGNLKMNEKIKLTLIARPTVEYDLIEVKAKELKTEKFKKMLEENAKNKKAKKKKEKMPKVNLNNLTIEKDDCYAAEREYWRTSDPYVIETRFTCIATFETDIEKEPEVFYIDTKCRIIQPDFLVHSKTQFIDFGPTVINTLNRVLIDIENISKHVITPVTKYLSPIGPFSCSISKNIKIETEHILRIPVSFLPVDENYVSTLIFDGLIMFNSC